MPVVPSIRWWPCDLATVELDGVERRLHFDESNRVPRQSVERLANPGGAPLILIEAHCGDQIGENDVERLDEIYARV